MTIYLFFYSLIFGLCLSIKKTRGFLQASSVFFLFATLFLFAGLRGMVGSDTPHYAYFFDLASSVENAAYMLSSLEPGFVLLIFSLRSITDLHVVFLLVYSGIQVFILYLIFIKTNRNPLILLMYVFLFYLNFHFNTIRAGLAALLLMLFLSERAGTYRYAALILAPLVHVSILFFYPFFVWKTNARAAFILAIISLLVVYITPGLAEDFYLKFLSYGDYLKSNPANPIFALVMMTYVGFSIFFTAGTDRLYRSSGAALIFSYFLLIIYPASYRILILAQLFYFYFMLRDFSGSWLEKKKVYFFWPFFLFLFLLNLNGILNEKNSLAKRVNAGELESEVFDSTYIPYKFFWD